MVKHNYPGKWVIRRTVWQTHFNNLRGSCDLSHCQGQVIYSVLIFIWLTCEKPLLIQDVCYVWIIILYFQSATHTLIKETFWGRALLTWQEPNKTMEEFLSQMLQSVLWKGCTLIIMDFRKVGETFLMDFLILPELKELIQTLF